MTKKQTFTISGMHCVSCAMNIDGELEDTKGVKQSTTNFAKSVTEVVYEEDALTHHDIVSIIEKVGYTAQPFDK
jgi:Cu+-exporting ATPase